MSATEVDAIEPAPERAGVRGDVGRIPAMDGSSDPVADRGHVSGIVPVRDPSSADRTGFDFRRSHRTR